MQVFKLRVICNLFLCLTFSQVALGAPENACQFDNNKIIAPSSSGAYTKCLTQPESYRLTIYKIGLCSVQPGAPTESNPSDLSNCATIFDNANGATVSVSGSTGSGLIGTATRPPDGSYNYAFVIADLRVSIDSLFSFTTGQNGGGSECWTIGGEYENFDSGKNLGTSVNYPLLFSCAGEINSNRGFRTVIYNSLDSFGTFLNQDSLASINFSIFLVKENLSLASQTVEAKRILVLTPTETTLNINSSTINLNLAIHNSIGAQLKLTTGGLLYPQPAAFTLKIRP